MFDTVLLWLQENLWTLLVGLIVLAVLTASVIRVIRDHQHTCSSASEQDDDHCRSCPMAESCHKKR